jgi:superfamily II helicase
MATITKAHMLECYDAFKKGKDCPYPEGMNPTSAEMTMSWLNVIWNDKRWDRSFSSMQAEVVLAQITIDDGENKARQVAQSIERDINLRHQKYGTPMKKHRRAIELFLRFSHICECCCTEQPLSAFIDNESFSFSSFKTCQRCRDVVPAHNKRNSK